MLDLPVESLHPELYHYTTRFGLEGILKSQTIWATNYRYLNDSSEITLAKARVEKALYSSARDTFISLILDGEIRIGDLVPHGGLDAVAQREAASLINTCFKAFNLESNLFIASFCGTPRDAYVRKNGLLSQWRGYGSTGGFCIEFKCRELINTLREESRCFECLPGHIATVIYNDDERRAEDEFAGHMTAIRDYFPELIRAAARNGDAAPDISKFLPGITSVLSRYKHRAFKEEAEVRAVWISVTVDSDYCAAVQKHGGKVKSQKPVKLRGDRVEYITLPENPSTKLPINHVIVGPQRDQGKVADEIISICDSLNISVECSDIPLSGR